MEPIGPLMREHRNIEKALGVVEKTARTIKTAGSAEPAVLSGIIQFYRYYADRTHHGKEEDILFKKLAGKNLARELSSTMERLVSDHVRGRELVGEIERGMSLPGHDIDRGWEIIVNGLEGIVALYPQHIEVEDKHFFYPALDYLTRRERDEMLEQYAGFDAGMIHLIYDDWLEKMAEVV